MIYSSLQYLTARTRIFEYCECLIASILQCNHSTSMKPVGQDRNDDNETEALLDQWEQQITADMIEINILHQLEIQARRRIRRMGTNSNNSVIWDYGSEEEAGHHEKTTGDGGELREGRKRYSGNNEIKNTVQRKGLGEGPTRNTGVNQARNTEGSTAETGLWAQKTQDGGTRGKWRRTRHGDQSHAKNQREREGRDLRPYEKEGVNPRRTRWRSTRRTST